MIDQTILQGQMGKDAREQLVAIAIQLDMTEAEVAEWAIKRCGLEVVLPNPSISVASNHPKGG